ncbi:putative hydrolase or acyltransferase of alpha/beta superfamily [Leptolyngbyaceae cyanobacterium JSC-12]|nr:putative hydrolase or acyltransferase of alpha/beta superfamily [Leptolyngbyaceae cyanobacterium JSC-12]
MLSVTTKYPETILYAQHGWADDHRTMASLASSLATPNTMVVTPCLGYIRTWLRINPLIQTVENEVADNIVRHPTSPIRVVGHSMGGLIWLEVLARHPEWWSRVESLVLVGSPVGGADLARAFDPLGIGVGIARDLGINRRKIAEAIAAKIPTLVIAGDIDNGSDGTVTVQCTKIFGAEFLRLPGIHHAALKNHPTVAEAIRQFWALVPERSPIPVPSADFSYTLIQRLQAVAGMTDGHERDFSKAEIFITYNNGVTIRTWKNLMGIDHVFVACPEGHCLYSGFVGWLHAEDLRQALNELMQEHLASIVLNH